MSRATAETISGPKSRLALATTEAVSKRLGAEAKIQIQEAGDFNWVQGEDSTRDIHDFVLMVLLAVLLAEQMMALRLSYHPRAAGARP